MLSKIIERAAGEGAAQAFLLDRVNYVPQSEHSSERPDTQALTRRIEQLEQELAQTEAAAYARGRRDADSETHERISTTLQNTADRLAQSVKQLAELRPRLCKEAEADVLRLAMAIAQRILHRQLNIDPTALEALVKVSLDRLGRQEQIRVRVSAALAETIRTILSKLLSRPVDVAADSNLEPGSLIFETSRGQLDASLNSQLDEIERGLIDRLENRAEK